MLTFFVVVCLLSLCSISLTEDCRAGFLKDMDFPGTEITFLYSPSAEHCQKLCTQHPSCRFFTFIRPDWTRDDRNFHCSLKATPSGEPASQTPLPGVTSGFSLKACNQDIQSCFPEVFENVDFFGADYRTLFTASSEECQRTCTQDPACQFFTFLNENFAGTSVRFKCHLKFSWNMPTIPVIEKTTGLVSGFSQKRQITQFDAACPSKFLLNTDIPGSDLLSLKAVSAEHCQVLCSAHPQCTYFSFASDDFSCFLKNNSNEMVTGSKDRITSGMPARNCQFERCLFVWCKPNTSNPAEITIPTLKHGGGSIMRYYLDLKTGFVKLTYEEVDFRGSDVRFELTDDADACQRRCTETPVCQFYTYINDNFSDQAVWRHCFLKSAITIPAPPKVSKLDNAVSGFTLRNCDTTVS